MIPANKVRSPRIGAIERRVIPKSELSRMLGAIKTTPERITLIIAIM